MGVLAPDPADHAEASSLVRLDRIKGPILDMAAPRDLDPPGAGRDPELESGESGMGCAPVIKSASPAKAGAQVIRGAARGRCALNPLRYAQELAEFPPARSARSVAANARHIYMSKKPCLVHIYLLFQREDGHMNMNANQAVLARRQLERRLAPLREAKPVAPPRGWIRAIRESLGMTTRQLAARMGVGPSRIPVIEKAEITGATTLKTLRDAAEALNCTFVYAFVPIKPLDEILEDRAGLKVGRDLARLDHTMRLENQALLKSDLRAEQRRMVDRVLSGALRGLWDDDHQQDHHPHDRDA